MPSTLSPTPHSPSIALRSAITCPVCYQPYLPPIHQWCAQGHLICSFCRNHLTDQHCPECREPLLTQPVRVRALETLIDPYVYRCQNHLYGCSFQTLDECAYRAHHVTCRNGVDVHCPCCSWVGKPLAVHDHCLTHTHGHVHTTREIRCWFKAGCTAVSESSAGGRGGKGSEDAEDAEDAEPTNPYIYQPSTITLNRILKGFPDSDATFLLSLREHRGHLDVQLYLLGDGDVDESSRYTFTVRFTYDKETAHSVLRMDDSILEAATPESCQGTRIHSFHYTGTCMALRTMEDRPPDASHDSNAATQHQQHRQRYEEQCCPSDISPTLWKSFYRHLPRVRYNQKVVFVEMVLQVAIEYVEEDSSEEEGGDMEDREGSTEEEQDEQDERDDDELLQARVVGEMNGEPIFRVAV